ncbi:helix-turn-helix domain-containing protein [Serratia rubidaea]|uniref:helix-turn-helix domain-containing protein n=1 Tax=Serratia rubidaea TaxID=61652 RepID=UPI001F1935AB|nr:helix-turn-helix domain-containing protein [Serratia rubidaea]UJD80084.1 helix-turn-helix domain-containing protein [Serratia rubidaea]UJD84640.1 helix-turn-helix domain-containing protein [Serratia rubidaea]
MRFGERLQQVIDELGISQSELGRRVGVTPQSVNGWCQSGILPRKEILELLPEATGKPLYWFFIEPEDEQTPTNEAHANTTEINDKQRRLLTLFEQLPTDNEQERIIEMISMRLDELDQVMAAYMKKRKIEPSAD